MQCPRCGLQNLPDITACARCGLPVLQGPPPGQPGAGQSGTPSGTAPSAPPAPPGGGYGPAPYGPPSGYGAPPAASSYGPPTQPQSYPPAAPAQQATAPLPPYTAPYGAASYGSAPSSSGASSPYSTGPVAPYGATSVLPGTARRTSDGSDKTAGLVRLVLLLGALTSAGYAIWALTARRGIFADFADNRSVSLDDAKTSDRLDTVFLIVAGAIGVIALALWIIRLMSGRARSGALTVAGLVICGLGLVCVVVGLVMSGLVGDGGNRIDEGQDALTATVVTGSGFIALAIGLLIGCLVVGSRRAESAPAYTSGAGSSGSDDTVVGPAGW